MVLNQFVPFGGWRIAARSSPSMATARWVRYLQGNAHRRNPISRYATWFEMMSRGPTTPLRCSRPVTFGETMISVAGHVIAWYTTARSKRIGAVKDQVGKL